MGNGDKTAPYAKCMHDARNHEGFLTPTLFSSAPSFWRCLYAQPYLAFSFVGRVAKSMPAAESVLAMAVM